MELSHDDVLEILTLIGRTDVEYLELELNGIRIVADKTGTHATATAAASATPPKPQAASATPSSPMVIDADLATVEAPVVGVFYRSPEPGAPPFVEPGDRVGADDTVGLIEVMKMFNSVTAGVEGEVVQILVGNEEFVEFGQPLLTIRPEAGP
jgi:acetyl-CoA carboxylase biotin carboxyl carrier protein